MNSRSTTMLDKIRFVMVETTHPGNVGAAARAMKTMGLSQLHLVRPKARINAEAVVRASGADDLLADARVHEELIDALRSCRLVIGSSARLRSLAWPLLEPNDCAERLLAEAQEGEVALVFGRESSGLTNEELARCHFLAHIPTDPSFSSLNVASAAQIFAYEIRRAWRQTAKLPSEDVAWEPAPAEAMEGFFSHLAQTMMETGFSDPAQSRKLQRRLRRLFNRARPDLVEINILRGFLSAAQGKKTPDRFRRIESYEGHPTSTAGDNSSGQA